jgi:hypothetical protein
MRTALAAALIATTIAAAAMLLPTHASRAEEVLLGADARDGLYLTIYAQGFALVEDARSVDLAPGRNRIVFSGVSPQMQQGSLHLSAPAATDVVELAYALDGLTPDALLRGSVGSQVEIVRIHPATGQESVDAATLLAVDPGIVLRYRDRIETQIPGRIVFPDVPAGLHAEPSVIASVRSPSARPAAPVSAHYLAEGLDWSADYVVVVDDAADALALRARAIVTNESGTDFDDARVNLVAGEVERAEAEAAGLATRAAGAALAQAAPWAAVEPQPFADLHLYPLAAEVDLPERQTRQFALFGSETIAFQRTYLAEHTLGAFTGGQDEQQPQHPAVQYAFDNRQAGDGTQEARPWPAGVVRVFGRDEDGRLRLIGEDRIGHTPVGARVELRPAKAFDITVRRRQTDLVQVGDRDSGVLETAWRIEVSNAKDRDVTVRLAETLPTDFTVLSQSAPHEQESARRLVWPIEVPAGRDAALTFRVRLQR